jgi:hypothetical protein
MSDRERKTAFNSPLETGLRSLAILVAAYPAAYDLQRLVELDYLVVHSGDANGPESLHAPVPLRAGELLVRRTLIERGLMLMMSRQFVVRLISMSGLDYQASDSAAPFLSLLQADYTLMLRDRAKWAVSEFGHMTTEEIRAFTRSFFDRWSSQFQPPRQRGELL